MKKILYIHHGKGLGGAPLSLLYLIENLDKTKFEPVVLFLQDSEVIELYKKKNIKVYGPLNLNDFSHTKIHWYRWYHPHLFIKVILDNIKTYFWIAKKWIDQIQPDIIHFNTSSLTIWAKVAKKKKIPVVFHVREPLADGYLGIRKRIIKNWVGKYSDFITPISNNDAKPWAGNNKVNVIYNAVDGKKFDKNLSAETFFKKYNLSKTDPKILFLGGLSQEKGTLNILKIFEQLLKILPEAKLIMAGYFDLSINNIFSLKRYFPTQRYKIRVKKILKKIIKSMIFTGPIKDVELSIAACDVLVVPSVVGHFARPIIEAGFMQKPVIAAKTSPLDELLIHGHTGYLLNINKSEMWVEKLYALLTNKQLNEQMGKNGYDFCLKNFNIQDHVKSFEQIYNKILEKEQNVISN